MKKIVIVGAGPGGYYAAVQLANAGYEVTLVDKKYAGGTCLNIGCIPSKTLLDHLSLFEHFQDSVIKKKIFSGDNIAVNLEGLRKFQLEVIKQLKSGLEKLFKQKKINLIYGEAKLVKGMKVIVTNNDGTCEINGDEIIIATGSIPKVVPTFNFDSKYIVSSDDIWNIPHLPQQLLIVGSGPIGIEFARVFSTLGSKVTIAEIKERMCPILDSEISENLVRSLKRRNIIAKPNCASKFLGKTGSKVKVEFLSTTDDKKEIQEYDQVLLAVGRTPNTKDLGLEEVGVEIEGGGFVKVDKFLETSAKNIWAIGDITRYPQLAHTASFQARIVSENITGRAGDKKEFQGDFTPSCIFGYPEVAFVGLTEEEAKEKGLNYKVGKYLFLASGKAKASGLTEGMAKIIMDTKTKKILGAHIIGPEASNLIHELVVAMQNDLTVEQVAHSIHAHPTYSEVVLEALENCLGRAVHV